VIHQVINLVIAVDERSSILGLSAGVAEELDQLVEMGDLADYFTRLDIGGLGLCEGDGA
jgi:hypothetical protein